jgi:hypothetical protein
MLAIQGIYDGKFILPLETIPTQRKYKIIITFVEEITEEEDIRAFVAQSDTFDFWENEEEDLYQDFLPKTPTAES